MNADRFALAVIDGGSHLARRSFLVRFVDQLADYYPNLRDRRFWAVQMLVLAVAAIHASVESLGLWTEAGSSSSLGFAPVALFLVPVGYAALNFGLSGSLATAVWCTLLVLPNLVIFHSASSRLGELLQIGIVDMTAFFVGQRVDREVAARRHAENAVNALSASENKYRSLFQSSPLPVLIVSRSGNLLEANPSAGDLFGRAPELLRGIPIAELAGTENAKRLLERSNGSDVSHLVLQRNDGSTVYLTPTFSELTDDQEVPALRVVLADVTAEHQRQAGLRAYAAHIVKAQEEERKRIAQEIHDDAVQRMILLCRKLDFAEDAGAPLSQRAAIALSDARAAAEQIAQDLRNYARALRPPILDDLGLVASLRRLLTDLAERSPITSDLAVAGTARRLAPNMELTLYRIGQEALSNVERHSRASSVALTVDFGAGVVGLRVEDNGIGFSRLGQPDFAAGGQLGLLGMQERAETLGGRLQIESTAAGTTVSVTIPV